MKKILFLLLTSFSLVISNLLAQTSKSNFKMFNAILFDHTPDLSAYGLHKINIIYEDSLMRYYSSIQKDRNMKLIDTTKFIRAAQKVKEEPNVPVCLDIESWQMNTSPWRSRSMPKYQDAINYFRQLVPNNKMISYFGYNINPDGVVFPSFYTINNDRAAWKKNLIHVITQIREKYPNVKIYAFLWPQYNPEPQYGLSFSILPADYWRFELETTYKYADGIVVWTHYRDQSNKRITFDYKMPWFQQTLAFIREHNIK